MSPSRPFRRRRGGESEPESDVTEYMPPAAVPDDGPDAATDATWAPSELVEPPGTKRWGWLRRHKPGPVAIFAIGFLFLLAAVAAAGFAHFTASGVAPWLSIGYSGAAVFCTVLALVTGRER
jgi:hypothetical protein